MQNFYSRVSGWLPSKKEIKELVSHFSKKEHFVFWVLATVLCLSTLAMLQSINKSLMVDAPKAGGSFSEGIIGTPRFVNPVLAFTDADQDLVSLIYSGLMRKNPEGGLTPDLAEKYEVSKDGLVYAFTLKKNIYFHDGKPVTADDVIFTVNKIKDSVIKSPRKADWDGVTVEKTGEGAVRFILKQPYASFLENTTIGIMPAHLWSNSPIELNEVNTNPVGSGPYMIKSVGRQSSGTINYYELTAFKKFALGKPYIKNIMLRFYSNESELVKALESGEVEQISSISPSNAEILKEKGYLVRSSVLPRVFGLFFNQNANNLFIDKTVIKSIDKAIDKDRIVREVLAGYGIGISGPIPPNMLVYQKLSSPAAPRAEILKKVREDLAKDGWKIGKDGFLEKTKVEKKKKTTIVLEFSISTGNVPELAKTAALIKEDLAAVGIKADIKTFEAGNLNQGVIRPRKYDALLFGEIVNRVSDLFAFWHSSQRKDPGLNVAMYTSAKVDKILEEAFVAADEKSRTQKYIRFEEEIRKDAPAVFLYSPDFIYIVSKNIKGFPADHIVAPADRFLNAHSWYIETDSVWKIFY